jgi:hypothetical protein
MNSIDNKEFSKSVNSSNYNSLNKKEKFNNNSSNSKKYLKTKDRYNKGKGNTSIQSVNASQNMKMQVIQQTILIRKYNSSKTIDHLLKI